MTVQALQPREARHHTGAIVRSRRFATQFEMDGHVLTLGVEPGVRGGLYYLPSTPTFDDGTPVPREIAAGLQSVIEEVERFWGHWPEFRATL
ncbi:hypothetical protein Aph02nite_89840 [Actinoplanes philippinensis]|uniref:Uncharacterized protein n=1 Tax=Actinoplanes philippinensis TaxID=35752 RepID=A0A1I2MAG1_9ACTN|nr:hypothetical protein [Actinoplanes philippinensis]GIE83034.1 hypothetical protein Aph02nite_89840 [Actinoplanes philippinensis]SFF86191.1 hypothetical protein SAMN05421541_12648 [Actinoplanes philippinensis]